MNKYIKYLLTLLCTFVCIFNLIPLSSYAAETDYDVIFPFAEPYVNENQGYIVYECKDSNGNYSYYLYYITCFPVDYAKESSNAPVSTPMFTVLAPSVSSNLTTFNVAVRMDSQYSYFAQGTFYYTSGQPFYQDPIYQSSGGLLVNITYGIPSKQTLTNYYCRGPWQTQGGVVPFDPTLKVGFLGDDSNYYNQLQQIITNLATLHSDNIEQVNKLVNIINSLVQLHSDNVDQLNKLIEILTVDNKINSILNRIYEYLIEEQSFVLTDIDFLLMDTNTKLDTIIDLLQPDTDVNVSKVDPSNFNEYNKAEQSLLDNNNVDVSSALKVEVDQNALLYIWPLAEEVLNTHPQVIGLVFTILSISIVALVLGRKGG